MEAALELASPFFDRIDRDLERSRELRRSLQDLLGDVRRANQRQSGESDALQIRPL